MCLATPLATLLCQPFLSNHKEYQPVKSPQVYLPKSINDIITICQIAAKLT